ncbi:hypothetical protein ACQJBY_012704 [Aegilops geniculata]
MQIASLKLKIQVCVCWLGYLSGEDENPRPARGLGPAERLGEGRGVELGQRGQHLRGRHLPLLTDKSEDSSSSGGDEGEGSFSTYSDVVAETVSETPRGRRGWSGGRAALGRALIAAKAARKLDRAWKGGARRQTRQTRPSSSSCSGSQVALPMRCRDGNHEFGVSGSVALEYLKHS